MRVLSEVTNDESTVDLPLVLVRWHDAWYDADQGGPEVWREDYLVRTVGFVVREEPAVLSVAQEVLPEHEGFRAVTHIPRALIESVHHLGAVEPELGSIPRRAS